MKIKKLKKKHPLIYKAAMDKLEEEQNEDSYLHLAFMWDATKEGYSFWDNVDDKNFKEAYKICPELKPKKSEMKELKNYTLSKKYMLHITEIDGEIIIEHTNEGINLPTLLHGLDLTKKQLIEISESE